MSNALAHIIPPPLETTRSLADLEQIVERGLTTFVDVGRALAEISERRLYREQGFTTFEEYCAKRWGWSRDAAYKYIRAADVVANVEPVLHRPENLRQALELAPLPPDQQREVAETIDFSKATVRDVREAVRERQQAGGGSPRNKPRSERAAEIQELAQTGHRAEQISSALGITAEYVRLIAKQEGIKLPDAVLGKTRRLDLSRIIERTVLSAQSLTTGLDELVDNLDDITADQAAQWAAALSDPIKALNQLGRQLKKRSQQQ